MRVRLESAALPEIAEAEGVDPTRWEGRQTAYMPAQVCVCGAVGVNVDVPIRLSGPPESIGLGRWGHTSHKHHDHQPNTHPQPPLPATPAGLEPSGAWASGVLQNFLDLRLGLAALEVLASLG